MPSMLDRLALVIATATLPFATAVIAIADDTVEGFVAANGPNSVHVRSPESERLAVLLATHGASATASAPGVLDVTGASTDLVGDVAAANGITIHELSLQQVTLEEAFMELTHDSVEYRTDTHDSEPTETRSLVTQESAA